MPNKDEIIDVLKDLTIEYTNYLYSSYPFNWEDHITFRSFVIWLDNYKKI